MGRPLSSRNSVERTGKSVRDIPTIIVRSPPPPNTKPTPITYVQRTNADPYIRYLIRYQKAVIGVSVDFFLLFFLLSLFLLRLRHQNKDRKVDE